MRFALFLGLSFKLKYFTAGETVLELEIKVFDFDLCCLFKVSFLVNLVPA